MVPLPHLLPKFPHFSSPSNSKLSFSLFRKQTSKTNKQTKPQNVKTQNSNPPKTGETDTHKQTNNKNHKKQKIGNHNIQEKDQ